jgi:hypothetical protein
MRIALLIILITSCQKNPSAFNSWKNGDVIELKLSEKTTTLKDLEKDCDYIGEIKGNSESGHIHFCKNEKCQSAHHPIKSKYTVSPNSLQVCTDYRDGDHTCEKFKTQ